MKKIHRCFCIPFIIICMSSIFLMFYMSSVNDVIDIGSSIIITIIAFITIIIGIFTDSTYFIREKITKKGNR